MQSTVPTPNRNRSKNLLQLGLLLRRVVSNRQLARPSLGPLRCIATGTIAVAARGQLLQRSGQCSWQEGLASQKLRGIFRLRLLACGLANFDSSRDEEDCLRRLVTGVPE